MRRICRKAGNSGFTIVELLIAVTILSIVIVTVCGFIVVGSRSYAAGNSDINVQQEAQLALNQMSDVLIDTTRSVTYSGYDAGGNVQKALKDAEFSFSPEDKRLLILNGVVESVNVGGTETQKLQEGNGNKHYCFHWSKEQETLYYAEVARDEDVVDSTAIAGLIPAFDTTDPDFDAGAAGWVVLADHVTDFSVDLTQVEEKRVVQLALTFLDGNKEYVTSNNVTIRNKVAVNDAELDPLNKKKTLKVTPRDSGVILEPTETYHFSTPKVTGENVTDRSVVWSLATPGGNSPTGATAFTDAANGVLQIAMDEPAGTLDVVITTNAVDSDGNHATCTLTVYIKRVSAVTLTKTADEDAENGANEVSVGNAFTIGATIEGEKIGAQCSGCTLDITHDHDAVDWRWSLVSGTGSLEVIDSADCQPSRYRVAAGTTVGTKFKIEATSELSKNRPYPNVDGAIILTVRQAADDAEPYGGKLKYGEQTLDEGVREGLPTDYSKYVTAIRVVDNSGKEPDKVLLHYTIGGGNNYRICPDLFDLDLNGSYTFYLQALFPIAEDRYVEGQGGEPDDNETIRAEYFSHLNPNKPYGYVGTKYRHGKVFYAKLDRPKLIYRYQEVDYSGKNITYDPVNIYTVGLGSGIVGEIRPVGYENIVEDNSAWTHITNSLYEGEGSNPSAWEKLYYVNDDSIHVTQESPDKKTMDQYEIEYFGNNTLASGSVQIDPKGSMFMKLNNGDHRLEACGDYHIVPGMVYQNLDPGHYEIIGYQGFDFPNLPRKLKYYEFDDSTIHVKVNADFTMDLNSSQFKGKALFPLPKEMEKNPLFPDMRNLEWQTSSGELWVTALREGQSNTENIGFTYVRYRYIKNDNAWEVEPIREEYDTYNKKIRTYSYGIHKCGENDEKWVCIKAAGSTERTYACNLTGVLVDGTARKMYFPLPSEKEFPFRGGVTKISCNYTHQAYELSDTAESDRIAWLEWHADVIYTKNGDKHRITFVERYGSGTFGTFECTDGATAWTQVN